MARELGEFARRHELARVGQPIGIPERGFGQAEFARPLGHLFGELVFAAGNSLREHDAGVVARLDDDAVQQIVHRYLAVDGQEHGRSVRRRAAAPPSIGADAEFGRGLEPALLELVEDDFRRHQLGKAGGGNEVVGGLFEQYAAPLRVDQDGVRGGGLKAFIAFRARDRIGGLRARNGICRVGRHDHASQEGYRSPYGRTRAKDVAQLQSPGHEDSRQSCAWNWLTLPSRPHPLLSKHKARKSTPSVGQFCGPSIKSTAAHKAARGLIRGRKGDRRARCSRTGCRWWRRARRRLDSRSI